MAGQRENLLDHMETEVRDAIVELNKFLADNFSFQVIVGMEIIKNAVDIITESLYFLFIFSYYIRI